MNMGFLTVYPTYYGRLCIGPFRQLRCGRTLFTGFLKSFKGSNFQRYSYSGILVRLMG